MNSNPTANPPSSPFRLFISYAHDNEACKDRLRTHLAPLERNGIAKVWDDRAIPVGALWRKEIEGAMASADAVIFLLDENFIASDFCMDVEVPEFLKNHQETGTLIIFVVTDYCGWPDFPFISQHKVIPLDGRPITSYKPYSKAYTHIKDEINGALALHRPKPPVDIPPVFSKRARTADSSEFLSCHAEDFDPDSSEGLMPVERGTSLDLLLAKLPSATTHLFGRDSELAQINSWKDHNGVFLWVADGGTGKSALVRWWLEHQEWPAGARFLGHSFYSQGSHNQATSARSFLLDALKQLNVTHEINAADDELGRLLAKAVAKESTVLVLDGIEPLQQISEDEKLNGLVKDRGLAALLEELVKSPGKALCLASSRLPIPDVSIADGSYFKEKTLGLLPPDGALLLLRQRRVHGEDGELGKMAERCGYHPLALVLAAEFCHTFLQGRAAEFLQREWQPKTCKAHASTIMTWFDNALAEEQQALDRELARILGLFDRPAPWGALLALKQAASIPGFTAMLHDADETTIIESLSRLSQWGLLNADLTRREPELDAHPLVREHFGALLEREESQAWKAAHSVLFDWFRSLPVKDQPDTLEELEPLYRAIGHGCKAGRYLTALENVFISRIHRNEAAYGLFQLGGYSTSLAALASFFPKGWNQPPVAENIEIPEESLGERACSWLISSASFCFAALGWLDDALVLREADRSAWLDADDQNNFCASNLNMMNLLALLGRWREAELMSREALDAAFRIEDKEKRWQRTIESYGCLGRTFHNQGSLGKALLVFKKAEAVLVRNSPRTPQLYSSDGYDYARLLLEQTGKQRRFSEALDRGRAALKIDKKQNSLISLAFEYCIIGIAKSAKNKPDAGSEFNQAVTTMRRAGMIQRQPEMHLASASHLRATRNLDAAWNDHDAAHSIAVRGNMRTYLAECALLAGNLYLDDARIPEAASQYATASLLIREDGYGRRYAELYLLHTRLLYAQHDQAALQALAEAEARIRDVGQWFFWRELCAVAKEIGAPDPGKCPA
jgi:tetratricopeptide (TPR) repeat protein